MISKPADKVGEKKLLQRDRMETKLRCEGWLSIQNDGRYTRWRERTPV